MTPAQRYALKQLLLNSLTILRFFLLFVIVVALLPFFITIAGLFLCPMYIIFGIRQKYKDAIQEYKIRYEPSPLPKGTNEMAPAMMGLAAQIEKDLYEPKGLVTLKDSTITDEHIDKMRKEFKYQNLTAKEPGRPDSFNKVLKAKTREESVAENLRAWNKEEQEYLRSYEDDWRKAQINLEPLRPKKNPFLKAGKKRKSKPKPRKKK